LLKSATLYSEVDEQRRARPQLPRVEQTRSELVFGMPAPWRSQQNNDAGQPVTLNWIDHRGGLSAAKPTWREKAELWHPAAGRAVWHW
jgi:hypothetical protein